MCGQIPFTAPEGKKRTSEVTPNSQPKRLLGCVAVTSGFHLGRQSSQIPELCVRSGFPGQRKKLGGLSRGGWAGPNLEATSPDLEAPRGGRREARSCFWAPGMLWNLRHSSLACTGRPARQPRRGPNKAGSQREGGGEGPSELRQPPPGAPSPHLGAAPLPKHTCCQALH